MRQALINAFRKKDFKENKILAKVLFFDENNKGSYDLIGETKTLSLIEALTCFANIPNPASQLIEAFSEKELLMKRNEMIQNMLDSSWIESNIVPVI